MFVSRFSGQSRDSISLSFTEREENSHLLTFQTSSDISAKLYTRTIPCNGE